MIGTFWNLCRACPSMPVDKLHSEYRSTYRWHEYTGPRQEIVRRPPQNTVISQSNNEPNLHRRKKYPDLAYRAHDFLVSIDNSGSDGLLEQKIVYDRARSEERWGASRQKSSRRSKSEGPPGEQPSYRLIYTKSGNVTARSVAQHKSRDRSGSYINDENVAPPNTNQNENMKNTPKKEPTKNEASEYRLQFAWPAGSKALNSRIDDIYSQHTPRKSISMNGIKSKGTFAQDTVPVHKKINRNQSEMEVLRTLKPNTEIDNVKTDEQTRKHVDEDNNGFKSEYTKNFQSFTKYDFDENKGVFEKRVIPLDSSYSNENEIDSPSSSWYKEVVCLRKKANQYKYRGWGTELVPDHIAQVYNNQMMVWEQVSRRSTLSALSLATTILKDSRSSSKEEKEKENKRNSPTKSLTRLRSAKAALDSSGNHESRIKQKNVANVRNTNAKNRTESSPDKGNTRVKKSVVERSSPKNTSRIANSNAPATIHSKVSSQGSDKPKRRPRPTSLVTSVPSGSKSFAKKKDESGKHQTLLNTNKKGRRRLDDNKKQSEEPMVVSKEESEPTGEEVPDFPDVGDEQIVKSPPEPTRVKSPEQIVMRSPEPVNWTVPLDTGKTFTVTQNVHEGDLVPRSYSEARAWTPTSAPPPPASISAPTELLELAKTNIPG